MVRLLPTVTASRRRTIAKQLSQAKSPQQGFYILTGVAAVIVTLGLIIDSSPVVIGGMLIAPLFEPIMALSLAVVTGRVGLLRNTLWALAKAVLGAVALAIIISFFSPFKSLPGEEILSRTNPNIIHLFIALFTGAAGAFAVISARVKDSLVGVLIAAALLPPLGVLGHSLVAVDLVAASGAFLLFLTNLVVLVFTSTVFLLLFGFRPASADEGDQELLMREIRWSAALITLLAIPLTYSLIAIVTQNQRVAVSRAVVLNTVPGIDARELERVDVRASGEATQVAFTLRTSQLITSPMLDSIATQLERSLDDQIILDATILPVIRLTR